MKQKNAQSALYNSRIIRAFVDYLEETRPEIDIEAMLVAAGMTRYEVEDPGHWFGQKQVDRFYEKAYQETRDQRIARQAGRFFTSSFAMGAARQFAMSFGSLTSAYLLMGRVHNVFSRGAQITTRRLSRDRIEIIAKPRDGVEEKLYQCDNRLGAFESLATLYINQYANIEHPECYHKGDGHCRYIVTWEKTAAEHWRFIRNGLLLTGGGASIAFALMKASPVWIGAAVIGTLAMGALLTFRILIHENNSLRRALSVQGNAAGDLLNEIAIRHDSAVLVQETGLAISNQHEPQQLVQRVLEILESRLDYDGGMILLHPRRKCDGLKSETYSRGSVAKPDAITAQDLDDSFRGGAFSLVFNTGQPIIINRDTHFTGMHAAKTREIMARFGATALLCAPIRYEGKTFGLIIVYHQEYKRTLGQSDLNLLTGVASQTAVSLVGALAYQKLHESRQRFRAIFETAEDAVFIKNKAGQYLMVNPSTERHFGRSRETLAGKTDRELFGKEVGTKSRESDEYVLTMGRSHESVITKPVNGALRTFHVIKVPMRDKAGNITGLCGIARDVSEQKRVEEELRQSNLALEASMSTLKKTQQQLVQIEKMASLGSLVAGVAHEINTPLGVGITASSFLVENTNKYIKLFRNDQIKRSDLARYFNTITEAANIILSNLTRAAGMVRNFKQVAADESNEERLHFNLKNHFTEIFDDLAPRLQKKKINIRLDCPEDLVLDSYPAVYKQVLSHLVLNSITHAFESLTGGRIEVDVRIENDRYLRVSYRDNGKGMDEDTLKQIFDPFFTTKRGQGGTGLGMHIVYNLIAQTLKGSIDCSSRVDGGVHFDIAIPLNETMTLPLPSHAATV